MSAQTVRSQVIIEQIASTSSKAGKAAGLELHPAAAKKPPKASDLCEHQRQRSRCRLASAQMPLSPQTSLLAQNIDFQMRDQKKSSNSSAGAGAVRGCGGDSITAVDVLNEYEEQAVLRTSGTLSSELFSGSAVGEVIISKKKQRISWDDKVLTLEGFNQLPVPA